MAEKYGMLPTEILSRGSTMDLFVFNTATMAKVRAQKKQAGESIADTYSQEEIMDKWKRVKGDGKE
jgi:hypothetical protein